MLNRQLSGLSLTIGPSSQASLSATGPTNDDGEPRNEGAVVGEQNIVSAEIPAESAAVSGRTTPANTRGPVGIPSVAANQQSTDSSLDRALAKLRQSPLDDLLKPRPLPDFRPILLQGGVGTEKIGNGNSVLANTTKTTDKTLRALEERINEAVGGRMDYQNAYQLLDRLAAKRKRLKQRYGNNTNRRRQITTEAAENHTSSATGWFHGRGNGDDDDDGDDRFSVDSELIATKVDQWIAKASSLPGTNISSKPVSGGRNPHVLSGSFSSIPVASTRKSTSPLPAAARSRKAAAPSAASKQQAYRKQPSVRPQPVQAKILVKDENPSPKSPAKWKGGQHLQRPESPLKDGIPPFYNVRLSDKPIFLRRTTIKPPSLQAVDRLPSPVRSPVKPALPVKK